MHDFLWENVGIGEEWMSDEWPLQIRGDDEAVGKFCRLMNGLQVAIKASGQGRIDYENDRIL